MQGATFKSRLLFCFPVFILILISCAYHNKNAGKRDRDFIEIFDGKSLDHWKGDSTYWSVEEGNLTGKVTPETILKRNTFIIWQGKMPDNFELKVEYKISEEGNSGINYRSQLVDGIPYALRGYQADLNGLNTYTGSNYEERGRTTLASQGEKVMLPVPQDNNAPLKNYITDNFWKPRIIKDTLVKTALSKSPFKINDWNEYHIIAKYNHLQHYVNGVLLSDVTDNDTINRRFNGLLGVQVHVGPPMKIAYRNFRLKKLN
jgi:hypothetical protein